VPLWVWICLAVSLGVVVPATVFLVVAGVRLWRRVKALEESTGMPIESLLASLDDMNERLERANDRAQDIEGRLEHLNEAMEKVAVLRWALGDARSALGFWRSLSGR